MINLAACMALLDSEEDAELFSDIYRKHKHKLFSISFGILQNHEWAEEALSDAFLRIARNFHRIRQLDERAMIAYMVSVVENSARDLYDKEKSQRSYCIDEVYPCGQLSDRETLESVSAAELKQVINELDEKQKAAITYKFFYGYTVSEIADIMNISTRSVNKYIKSAKSKLLMKLNKSKDVI